MKKINFKQADNYRSASVQLLYYFLEEGHLLSEDNFQFNEKLEAFKFKLNEMEFAKLVYSYKLCLENLLYVDYCLNKISNRSIESLDPLVRCVLRLATAILLFAKQKNYATVNEFVDIVKLYTHQGNVAFVNAVLRALLKNINIFSDLTHLSQKNVALRYGFNKELFGHFKKDYGLNDAQKLAEALVGNKFANSLGNGLFIIRNPFLVSDHDFQKTLNSDGFAVYPLVKYFETLSLADEDYLPSVKSFFSDLDLSYYICLNDKSLTSSVAFNEGYFYIQGLSASLASDLISKKIISCCNDIIIKTLKNNFSLQETPKVQILDACSAPGGKSIYNIFKIHNSSLPLEKFSFHLFDCNNKRLSLLDQNLERLGLKNRNINIHSSMVDCTDLDAVISHKEIICNSDVIIVDAPCSASGLLSSKPEIKFLFKHESLLKLCETQKHILYNLAAFMKKGAYLFYSTCSLLKSENEKQIADFLQTDIGKHFIPCNFYPDQSLLTLKYVNAEACLSIRPDFFPAEGFFIACLQKKI